MSSVTHAAPASGTATKIGYVLSGIVVLFLLFDAAIKLVPIQAVTDSMLELGYPTSVAFARGIGALTLVCMALYTFPPTAVLGAILLTGLFGGAIATHVRVGSPIFTHVLFGLYLGLLAWGGLFLRDDRVRALIPFRR